MRVTPATLVATLVASTPAAAQVLTSPPKGIIVPNYDMVRIGQTEALESGAVVAQASGPLANVYNPAGLAATDKTAINASSTGYQLIELGLEGVGKDVSSSRLTNLGGFLGVVVADPVIKSKKWRLGFAVFSPIGWEPGTLSGANAALISGQDVNLDYRTDVGLRVTVPALAAGTSLSKRLRLGFGVQVPVVSILQVQNTTALANDATQASSTIRAYAADGTTWLVRGTLGLQWEASKSISVGIMAETPTARLFGSSFYSDQTTTAFSNGFETLDFRDPSAHLEYKLPFLLSGGVAVMLGKVQVEGDVRWYGSVGQYDLYRSDSTGIALAQDDGGLPTRTPVVLSPVTLTYQSAVNFAIGASIPISKDWQIHLGMNSDQSPLPNTDELFRKVSLIGVTAGVAFRISRVSGAFGLGFQSGTSPVTDILVSPVPLSTKVTVKTFQLMYSLAYTF
jgi:hypothetical protein